MRLTFYLLTALLLLVVPAAVTAECWTCEPRMIPCPGMKLGPDLLDCKTQRGYECKPTFWGTLPEEKVYQTCQNSSEPPPGVVGPVLPNCTLGPRCLKAAEHWDQSSDVAFVTMEMLRHHGSHVTFITPKGRYSLTWNWERYDTSYLGILVEEKGGRSWTGVDGIIPGQRGGNYPAKADGVMDQADYDSAPRFQFDRRAPTSPASKERERFWQNKYEAALADVRSYIEANWWKNW
jgi:hypothetical protein